MPNKTKKLNENLTYLKLTHIKEHLIDHLTLADQNELSKLDFLQSSLDLQIVFLVFSKFRIWAGGNAPLSQKFKRCGINMNSGVSFGVPGDQRV